MGFASIRQSALLRCVLTFVLILAWNAVRAGPQSEVLSVDLAPLIDRAVADPGRFAVEVPHTVGLTTHGDWSVVGTRRVWRYSIQIPTAVSLSFHAAPIDLPPSAQLKMTAGGVVYLYSAKDVNRGQLWSRIARGDAFTLELSVAASDMASLRFAIVGFQAGYRGLGHGVANHPHFDKLQSTRSGTQSGACEENWSCHVDPVNTGAGQGTVALIIADVGQCTGVLLNDVPGDGKPYVLTARHCENGDSNGGSPGAAANITVYWDAVVPCGDPLGTIYDAQTGAQSGATTLVEQQDAWLVQLDKLPPVDDAFYAGWDATGSGFSGGFTPHHALGTSRQFIGWAGQASYNVVQGSTLGVGFTSTLWGTVNAVGSGGGGSSGSGLFDGNGRLTGTVVRGVEQSGSNEAGVCPVSPTPTPSLQTATTLATALSGIFSSTADPDSTTGSVTIQSVLDPAHSGTMVLDGQTSPPVASLYLLDGATATTGSSVGLQWTSQYATSCTASGGDPGDGWSGTVATSGSLYVISQDGGAITYTLTCTNGVKSTVAQVQVNWTLSQPVISLLSYAADISVGMPFQITWTTNVRGCTASGGIPGDGWAGAQNITGTATVTETTVGAVTYTLTCGTGNRIVMAQTTAMILAPSVALSADAPTLQTGQSAQITVGEYGLPCVNSGGSSTDGWSADTTYASPISVTETVPGTYTYTVTCGSAGHTATSQVSVVFADGPASVTLTSTANTAAANSNVTLTWAANVRPCVFSTTGPDAPGSAPVAIDHSSQFAQSVLGTYVYTVTCGAGSDTASASTSVTVTGTPFLRIFQPPGASIANRPFVVEYLGNLSPCVRTGGTSGDGWAGSSPVPYATDIYVTETSANWFHYTVTCGTGSQTLTEQLTVIVAAAAPMVSMSANKTYTSVGEPVTISWTSNVSPCAATGGAAGDGWGGAVAISGSLTLTETAVNQDWYGIACGGSNANASASVSVAFRVNGPPSIDAYPTSAQVGQSVTLNWGSQDGSTCVLSGGSATDGWAGNGSASGVSVVAETSPGTYTYTVTCGSEPPATLAVVFTAPPSLALPPGVPTAQLVSNESAVNAGSAATLTWTVANVDSCTAGGGSSADGWTGSLSLNGSQPVSETTPGTYTYTITCAAAGQTTNVSSSATVTVNAVSSVTVTGSSGKSGGGGTLTWLELTVLGAALAARRRRFATLR